MKKLLTLLLIFSAFTGSAQVYQNDPSPGRTINGYKVKKTLFIPPSCGTPSFRPVIDVPDQPAIAYDTCNHIFYVYDPSDSSWKQSGISVDSLLAHVGDIAIPQAPDSSVLKVKNLHGDTTNVKFVFDDGASTGMSGGGTYTLPTASSTVLGGVKVGSGLSIDGGGLLSGTYTASTGLTMVGTDIQLGGTLNNNTQINAGTNSLTLSGAVNNFTGVFTVNNTQSGYAIRASGSGNNVPTIYGTSSGMQSTAVAGTASGYGSDGVFGGSYNEYGGKFNSFIGVPLYAYRDSGTFGIDPVVQLVKTIHHPNQYYATNGMGQSIQFLQSDTNRVTGYSMPILNSIVSSWQDTLTGKSIFYIEGLANRTTTNRIFSLSGDGRTTLSKYGSGTFAAPTTYNLGVDASGNITETNLSKVTIKSTDPTTTDIPDGYSAVYKNSTSGNVYLWANIGGTLLKTQLN